MLVGLRNDGSSTVTLGLSYMAVRDYSRGYRGCLRAVILIVVGIWVRRRR